MSNQGPTAPKQGSTQKSPQSSFVTFFGLVIAGALAFTLVGGIPADATAAVFNVLKSVISLDISGIGKSGDAPSQHTFYHVDAKTDVASIRKRGLALVAAGVATTTLTADCDPAVDLQSGRMNPMAIGFMEKIADAGFKFRVNCLKTGHSTNVHRSSNVSLHTVYQGMDIDQVNGQPVCARYGAGGWCVEMPAPSHKLIAWFKAQPNQDLPFEIGGPQYLNPGSRGKSVGASNARGGPFFTNYAHRHHIHFGFKPRVASAGAGGWWGP